MANFIDSLIEKEEASVLRDMLLLAKEARDAETIERRIEVVERIRNAAPQEHIATALCEMLLVAGDAPLKYCATPELKGLLCHFDIDDDFYAAVS